MNKFFAAGLVGLLCLPSAVFSQTAFTANLNAKQEVPTNASTATGFATVNLITVPGVTQVVLNLSWTGLSAAANNAHYHGPAGMGTNAGVQVALSGVTGTAGQVTQTNFFTGTQIGYLTNGLMYLNIHSTAYGSGEIRGQVLPVITNFAWKGTVNSSWVTAGNWEPGAVPTSGAVVVFSSAVVSNADTTLGGSWTVNTVRVTNPTNNISIGGPGVLTIGGGGMDLTSASVDLTLSNSMNVSLSAPQNWQVTAGRQLTVGASVSNNGHELQFRGGGVHQLDGVISGSGAVEKRGNGSLTINSRNTFSGEFTIMAGRVDVAVASWMQGPVLGTSNVVIRPGARLDVTGYHPFGYFSNEINPVVVVDGGTLAYSADAYTYALDLTSGAQVVYGDNYAHNISVRGRIDSRASASNNVLDITPNFYAGDVTVNVEDGAALYDLFAARGFSGTGLILTNTGALTVGMASSQSFTRVNNSAGFYGIDGRSAGTGRVLMNGGSYQQLPFGLWEGTLPGSFNTTDPVPPAVSANIQTLRANMSDGFPDNTTYVYWGTIRALGSVTWTFAENFDDSVLLKIDGTNVLNDTVWDQPTKGTIGLATGDHTFEPRLGQGGGGVGPVAPWALGVGVDKLGRDQLTPTNYSPLIEAGNAAFLFRTNGLTVVSNRFDFIAPSQVWGYFPAHPSRYAGTLDGGTSSVTLIQSAIQFGGTDAFSQVRLIVSNQSANLSLGNTFFAGQFVGSGGTVSILPGAQPAFAGEGSFPLAYLPLTGGVHRIVHGRAFATNIVSLSGATLDFDTAGLDEGSVPGAFNLTNANPGTFVRLDPVRAQSVEPALFGDDTTWVYSGLLNITNPAGVTWTFAEDFDDNVQLVVDGKTNLYNTGYATPSKTNLFLTNGTHTVELRIGNGIGGVGSPNGWPAGFGVDVLGRDQLTATNFVSPLDPGDGSLWRRASVTVTNGFRAAADSSLLFRSPGPVTLAGPLDVSTNTLTITTLVDSVISGTITGLGTLVKTGPGKLVVTNLHTGCSSLRIAQGVLEYPETSAPHEVGKFTNIEIAAGATLRLGPTGPTPELASGQTLRGSGSVDSGSFDGGGGTYAPGVNGPGTLTFLNSGGDGFGTFNSFGATFQMEIGGTVAGTGHDRIEVIGSFYLQFGTTLNASLINGFTPIVGDSFNLINTSSGILYFDSSFATVNLPPLGAGTGWRVDYAASNITLVVTGAPPTGYTAYAQQITTPQRDIRDDADGDGYANLLEYVTGGNPTNAGTQAALNAVIQSNSILTLVFNQNAAALDATLYVDATFSPTNNSPWTTVNICSNGIWQTPALVNQSGVYPNFVTTVRDTAPYATNRYMRLRVTRP